MHSELKLLIMAPEEIAQRVQAVLTALGESTVSADWRSAKFSEWHAVFCADLSSEQRDCLALAASSSLQIVAMTDNGIDVAGAESGAHFVLDPALGLRRFSCAST